MKTFAMKLREERTKRSMKQADLAEILGVSLRMIGDYENGKRRPHRAKMKQFAEILDLPYEYLADDSHETVLSVFNGVTDNTPAEEKYSPLVEISDDTEDEISSDREQSASAGVSGVSPRAEQEMAFIKAHAHALFAGADLPQAAKDKFFEALYDSYLACRAKAAESGMDVDKIERERMAGSADDNSGI